MVGIIEKRIQHDAYGMILGQLVGITVLASLVFLLGGKQPGLSVLAGGLAYSLPDVLFIWLFVRYAGIHAMKPFMSRFLMGKVAKLIVQSILVLLSLKYLPVEAVWVVAGFASCGFLFWVACIMHFSRQRGAV